MDEFEKAIYKYLLDKTLEKRAMGVKPEHILFSNLVKDFTHSLINLKNQGLVHISDTINDKYILLRKSNESN